MNRRASADVKTISQRLRRTENQIPFVCRDSRVIAGELDSAVATRSELKIVMQGNRLQDCADLVIAVSPPAENPQRPIDLRERGQAESTV
jgi:hypothetical protein